MEFKEDLDFIISYLDQAKKMDHYPAKVLDIILFLAKEIKSIKTQKQ